MRIHRELRCPSCGELSPLSRSRCAGCGHPLERERDAVEVESILSDIEELMELIQGDGAGGAGSESGEGVVRESAGSGGAHERGGAGGGSGVGEGGEGAETGPSTVKVEELFRCAICGSRVSADDRVCGICGTVLDIQPVSRLMVSRIDRTAGEIAPGEVELAQRPGPPEEARVGGPLEARGPQESAAGGARPDYIFAKEPATRKRVVRRIIKKR